MKTSTNTNSDIYLQDLRRKSANGADSTRPARREPRSYAQVSNSEYGYATRSAAPSLEKPAEAEPEPEAAQTIQLTPQAQQLQALPAAQLQSLQTQAQSVQQQKDKLMLSQPTYTEVARDSASKFFKDNFHLDLDPDTTYLNTFRPPSMDRLWTAPPEGYTHSGSDLRSSQSLTDLFLHNVEGGFTQQSQDMPQTYGIYTRQDSNAPYSSKDSLVPIAEFAKKFRQSDTLGEFSKRNDAFWSQNAQAIAQASRQDARLQVQLQKLTGQGGLSEQDYRDFDIATSVSAAQTKDDIHRGEIDEDRESVSRAIRRQHLSVSPLDIDGHSSHDILRVEDNESGKNLMYIPQDEQPLRKFDNRQAVGDWLHAQGGQPGWAREFAARHFSQNAAQGREALSGDMAARSNGLGVRKYLEQAAQNDMAWKKNPELHRSELPNWKLDDRKQLADHQDIQGDAFERLTQIKKEGSQADAKMDITTHADVDRGNVFKATDWLPFVGGGLKMGLAKTRQEQEQAGAALTLDVLTAPFDLAPGLAAKRAAKAGVQAASAEAAPPGAGIKRFLDEVMRPPQKVNGKLGYPMSPTKPPSGTNIGGLAPPAALKGFMPAAHAWGPPGKYDVSGPDLAAMFKRLRVPQESDFSDQQLRRQLLGQPEVAAQARALKAESLAALANTPRPSPAERPQLPHLPPDPTQQDLVNGVFKSSNGMVVGERHDEGVAWNFLTRNMETLKNNGVKTIFLEAGGARELYGAALRNLNETGEVANSLKALWPPRLAEERVKLLKEAFEHGIEVVPLENLASVRLTVDEVRQHMHGKAGPSTANRPGYLQLRGHSFDFLAAKTIEDHQAKHGNKPWVALTGSAHMLGDDGKMGIATLTDSLAVRVTKRLPNATSPPIGIDSSATIFRGSAGGSRLPYSGDLQVEI